MRIQLGVVASACLAVASAQAQSVRGQLTDSISRVPLGGAFLTLVDERGAERARAVTNHAGEFVLTAPAAGTYRVRSKRIGFRPYVSPALTLRAGETSTYHAVVDPIPVPLPQVVVAGERQCDIDAGASVAALWDEVREALAGVAWTRRSPGYWYEIAQFERDVYLREYRRGLDSTWLTTGFYEAAFRSAPAEQLASHGFVVVDGSGWTYYEPDADVLLSAPFLRTHCFETKIGRDETAGLVGLAFSPARGRNKPDITGTLWVDRQTAMLGHLEFKYVKLPQGVIDARAGGRVSFLRVPTGAWVVREWLIRMPIAVISPARTAQLSFPRAIGYRERGGTARVIKTTAGALVFRAASVDTIPLAAQPAAADVPAVVPVVAAASDTNRIRPVRPARTRDLLTQDEFAESAAPDAYGLVLQYRPQWLSTRGRVSINLQTGALQVYVNNTRWGGASRLRDIPASDVVELRYLSGPDATMRHGTNHAGGAIEVTTR
jgi:hypothetical protein